MCEDEHDMIKTFKHVTRHAKLVSSNIWCNFETRQKRDIICIMHALAHTYLVVWFVLRWKCNQTKATKPIQSTRKQPHTNAKI